MECSATFFATYSLGSEDKGEPGSQLVREKWKEIEQWVGSGCGTLLPSLTLSVLGGAVYYGSEAIFFFIVAKATLGPLRLPADHAALAEMLRLASKTHM